MSKKSGIPSQHNLSWQEQQKLRQDNHDLQKAISVATQQMLLTLDMAVNVRELLVATGRINPQVGLILDTQVKVMDEMLKKTFSPPQELVDKWRSMRNPEQFKTLVEMMADKWCPILLTVEPVLPRNPEGKIILTG